MTGEKCIVLEVQTNGDIKPIEATRDPLGGVKSLDGKKTWVSQSINWGTYERKPLGWRAKPERVPAVIAYNYSTQLVPLQKEQLKGAVLDHPAVLQRYLDADYLAKATRAAHVEKKNMAMPEWVKRVPRWAWIGGLALAAGAWTAMNDGRLIGLIPPGWWG